MRETPSKLSRQDGGGILTSGPESPRQVSATWQSRAEVACSHCCTVTKITAVPVEPELCLYLLPAEKQCKLQILGINELTN